MTLPGLATCRICLTDAAHRRFTLHEMYFGSREAFDYFECAACGTIQIGEIPADLGRHYPADYYSFSGGPAKPTWAALIALRRCRSEAWLGGGGALGRWLAGRSARRPAYVGWLAGLGLDTAARIVDVGCGGGELLLKMQRDGFRHLLGLDPFIAATRHHAGVTIHRRSLAEDVGRYDLIMLHHSFEHMADPRAAMAEIARHLAPGGRALLRLPIAGGYAWRHYGEHWYALDAPRHLVIPSRRAMAILAASAGLAVERHFFDSDIGQFLASEAYRQGIPLVEQMKNPPTRPPAELARLRALAEQLNRDDDGDCGGFVLRRAALAS